MQTPHSILKKYWQYDHFRPLQEDIITHVLQQKDTLAILPTGGGKSICYQIPALLLEGTCLVISPLLALMKDQAQGLQKRGIACQVVFSGMQKQEVEQAYVEMASGKYKFLFVSPERLQSEKFLDYVQDWNIQLIVVDEAHCISQWGYDFRPSYLEIAELKEHLPNIPILALTGSATPFVRQDIMDKLAFKNGQLFFNTFQRENISFSCFKVESKIIKTIDILQKVEGSSIVYCRSRAATNDLAQLLKANGLSADYYHAGLSQEIRNRKQEDWIEDKTRIIVCTNAFGMGIDKPNVRTVIHFDTPDTPEGYYQEAGRAGRDGLKAYAVLLYESITVRDLEQGISLRFPSIEKIKEIYIALAHYFQIGIGDGMDEVFDFELDDFCKRFKCNVLEAHHTIKLLEQQGYWRLSDHFFLPSRVCFMTTKETIENIEKQHPALDEILKLLLRLYGGIWNNYVPISEFQIAQHARVAKDYVEDILQQLHDHGIIDYCKAKEKPQLQYLHDRPMNHDVRVDTKRIDILKERYAARVHFMIDFIQNEKICRSNLLIAYFGETVKLTCGQCDICLKQKQALTATEMESVKNTILQQISLQGSLSIAAFCNSFGTLKQETILLIIRFLLDEKKVELNSKGELIAHT